MTEDISRRSLFEAAAAGAALAAGAVSVAAPAAAQTGGSSLDEIRKSGRVRMGLALAEPWAFKDPATNSWKGFSVSFGQAIAQTLGVELVIEEMAFPTLIAALQAEQVDFVPVLDATPERALAVDFTMAPLVWHAQSVLVEGGTKITTWSDLDKPDVSIAVPQGSVMEKYAREMAPKAQILAFPNNPEAVAAFQSRRATAVSLFGPALSVMRARVGRGTIAIPKPEKVAVSNVAIRRMADKSFRDWMNLAVSYYYNTGRVQEWYEEFLRFRGIDPASVPAVRRELW